MGALLTWIADTLQKLPGPAALALVFLLPALEASVFLGFLIPGEIAVVIGGFLAFSGKVNLGVALAAAILGAIIGDSVGYEVGKKWGDSLLTRLPARFVKPEHIEQGKQLINRLGGKAVFTGRFAAALRALVPGLCGVSRIPYRKFLFWNALGGIVWATGFTLLGYAAGNAWHKVEHYASVVSWVLLGLVVVGAAALFVVKRRKGAAEPAKGEGRAGRAGRADRADREDRGDDLVDDVKHAIAAVEDAFEDAFDHGVERVGGRQPAADDSPEAAPAP
ncbi:membrane-associated protein [Catenulispora sp. MAP5-51]|uniref:DedA family protein n=1 Tax=Catenulispora sp. MAP5-51 TaxID=3156298 RepID=UPI0035139E23